ncbi:MAG: dihydroorotate dehydrogenase [Spirochaetae bacterium HGW-Spirochaetae-1]|nr:MAG: dihydroorotate dehydrogenase [Spirochaetae bacterium HGW-Spirochaetae-1]
MKVNTAVKIGSLVLKNPVTVASGTAGYGEELSRFMDISRLGAIFTKGLSLKPRIGNRGNRVLETPSGLLNSIGLENVGLDAFLDKKLPFLLKNNAEAIPNVAGHSEDENVELCRILSVTGGIHAVELNVSCPNVKEGGIAFGTNLEVFTRLLEKVRKATQCVLIVKLSPNVTDITQFALRAQEVGVDALSAVNTYLGMKIDIKTGKPHFNNKVAGLSGPAIRPLAVRTVYQICEKVNIPVIGLGGIASLEDMLEFMMAGAAAISVGTMNMVDPDISVRLIDELESYMQNEKITDIAAIIGKAHR